MENDKKLRWIYERVLSITQPIDKAVHIIIINDEGVEVSYTFDEDENLEKSNFEIFKDAIEELMDKYPLI